MHKMVLIPKGEFMMGALDDDIQVEENERPRHKVILTKEIYIGIYPVTQRMWMSISENNPSYDQNPSKPVEKVSWFDAVEFCNKLSLREELEEVYVVDGENVICNWSANGYRLPTEAEWEYCARGSEYHRYAGSDNVDEVAWYEGNSGGMADGESYPVGLKKANAFGLYDMSGNVSEWCWDYMEKYIIEDQKDPIGVAQGTKRIFRGGGFDGYSWWARTSYRDAWSPDSKDVCLGFRLVRNA